jgi:AGCS family alanine or glycine:cation symporter
MKVSLVWNFSDAMNGAMAIPNLVGLLGLSYVVYQETMKYFDREGGGEE